MEALPHPATFPTPEHERVHDLLRRLISEGSARFFADACELSQGRSGLRTTTHLVGHLVRDVESAVRQVLRTLPPAQDILKGTKDHRRQVDAILEVFSLANDHIAIQWREFVGDSGSWARTAHRDDLRRPRELDAIFLQRFELFVAVLLAILDAAESNYSMIIAALETVVLKATPSPADTAFLAAHLAPGVTGLSHIFKSLSAAWLVPLRDRSVFSEPPDTQVHDGGGISFPRWPQAEYLARIAGEAPLEVANTIESVPTVDNESIHGAFLLAAMQMPPLEAARVAFHEAKWLGAHPWVSSQIPEALQTLVTHLIAGGEVDGAVSMLRVALSLTPVDRETLPGRESQPRISSWAFEEVVQKGLRPLAARAPEAAIVLLFDLIDGSGQASESWTWRKAIEEHQQNRHDDPIDHLLSVLRDLYDERVRGNEKALRVAVADLENRGKTLYRRLALYLLRQHGESTPDLIVERAVDQRRLDDHEEFHELACMIADRFAGLDDVNRRTVVAALRDNSSVEHFRLECVGAESEEQAKTDAKWRRRSWFAVLGSNRPDDVNAEYRILCADVGEPEHPTFMVWSSSLQGGPTPPRLADELLRLADPELLAYLLEWVPTSGDPFGASFRDLGREVKACATREPIRMSRLAREFRAQHPQYVTAIIWGVHEATINKATASAEIDWVSILDLSEWVVEQSNHSPDEAGRAPESWTWTRQMVVAVAEDAATLRPMFPSDVGPGSSRAFSFMTRIPPPRASLSPERMTTTSQLILFGVRPCTPRLQQLAPSLVLASAI